MRRNIITVCVVLLLVCGAMFYAASGRNYYHDIDHALLFTSGQQGSQERHMVDMVADDSYLVEQGDSTIFILVGNFAAHHNGTVILADSAVRYPNQSFECFGNVLINQNDTYAYGERAEYNRANNTATIYSELVKVVDGEAVMYTYDCSFNTAEDMGRFYNGCYVKKGESHLEAERGYYNTKTHDLIAVENVEMRDEKYLMTGDSVIFNTQTEDARYFTNTNIWNDKDEYLYANRGQYVKSLDLHNLTRDAYILSAEREIWSDTIEYYRTDEHIIGRRNIQMDDTTQKVLGFADYGEWWDDPGNAMFTRRPVLVNYDPDQPDSVFVAADTLWLYTIAVLPPSQDVDSLAEASDDRSSSALGKGVEADSTSLAESVDDVMSDDEVLESGVEALDGVADQEDVPTDVVEDRSREVVPSDDTPPARGDRGPGDATSRRQEPPVDRGAEFARDDRASRGGAVDSLAALEHDAGVDPEDEVLEQDSVIVDSIGEESVKVYTAKQLRYRAKLERRRVRDSVRGAERAIRDSLKAIRQAEKDSIRYIRDSLLDIKIDSIIAKRKLRSSQLADEEAARLARIQQKAEERNRRKIDKAKARALRRGKEYNGPDYEIDTLAEEGLPGAGETRDSMSYGREETDTLATDSIAMDSLATDSVVVERPFPEDSTYKMIKAYRHVRLYRSDSQMVCDSMVVLNTDSIIRMYLEPIMWNEGNQITSDSMAIHTENQLLSEAHFMGNPLMGMEIDTMYYNQVGGKDMIAYFADGQVYRNDVEGNAQTIYYMQEEDNPTVTGLMYIESASISFYLTDGEIDKISYKQNPEYVLYPMDMIPESQNLTLKDFDWYYDRRPVRDSVFDRTIRSSRRADVSIHQKPRFRITERIDYDRRRLVENRMWKDRVDQLTPEVIEWRNSRASYQRRR